MSSDDEMPPDLVNPDTDSGSEDEDDGPPRRTLAWHHAPLPQGRRSADDQEDMPELIDPNTSSDESEDEAMPPASRQRREETARRPATRPRVARGSAERGQLAGQEYAFRSPPVMQHFMFSMPPGQPAEGVHAAPLLGGAFVDMPGFNEAFERDVESVIFGEDGLFRGGLPPFMQMLAGYGLGDPLRQVLHASFQQQQRGRPPASSAALDTLVSMQVREGEEIECPIESENIEVGGWATRMPCGHWFSSDSLLKWLEGQNTCPTCRHELPTGDEEYNAQHRLSLEATAKMAEDASRNPADFLAKRLGQAMEEQAMDEIAEEALGELATGLDEETALDGICEETLSEIFCEGIDV